MYDCRLIHYRSISEEERKLMKIRGKATKLTEDNQRVYNDVWIIILPNTQYNRDYKAYQSIDKKRLELVNEVTVEMLCDD